MSAQKLGVGLLFNPVLTEFVQTAQDSFDYLDEVWVASRHVADAIRPDASLPVEVIRLPVTPRAPDSTPAAMASIAAG